MILPVRITALFLPPGSKEAKWLIRLAGVLEQRSGVEVRSIVNFEDLEGGVGKNLRNQEWMSKCITLTFRR